MADEIDNPEVRRSSKSVHGRIVIDDQDSGAGARLGASC